MRKNVLQPHQLRVSSVATLDLSTSFTTEDTEINHLDDICIILDIQTASNTGQFSIQGSLDRSVWVNLEFNPAIPALANANDQWSFLMKLLAYKYIRVKFIPAGGTPSGTATATIGAKEI